MATLVGKCPNTGRTYPTGVGGDAKALEAARKSKNFRNNQTQCVHCGRMHRWDSDNTWVEERPLAN